MAAFWDAKRVSSDVIYAPEAEWDRDATLAALTEANAMKVKFLLTFHAGIPPLQEAYAVNNTGGVLVNTAEGDVAGSAPATPVLEERQQ